MSSEHTPSEHAGGLTGRHFCESDDHASSTYWPCHVAALEGQLTEALALAQRLQDKVTRVEAQRQVWLEATEDGQGVQREHWRGRDFIEGQDAQAENCADDLRAALADPIPQPGRVPIYEGDSAEDIRRRAAALADPAEQEHQ